MKQIIQNYKTGELQLVEVPVPALKKGFILVQNICSLVSLGTEKAMIDIAKKSLLGKALARPDWVKQVVDKIKTEGLMEAWRQSKARLDMPVPLGYSCAGIVVEVDTDEGDFRVGDRVACAGSGYATHAEFNVVPPNLCVKIPKMKVGSKEYAVRSDSAHSVVHSSYLSFEDASYVALGGIAMEAVRLAKVELGYRVGVIGLGLIGQLAVQILRAAGCHVIGIDISAEKCVLAMQHGAEAVAQIGKDDPISISNQFSDKEGLDAVIIFASTKSNEPLIQAAQMCRERGRIIAGGLTGLDIPRKVFYEKELDFAVSRAWGPGMYDLDYEERNMKYPLPYVRWTAKRNMEEFLNLLALGTVKTSSLTTHRFPFEKALEAYEIILKGKEPAIGVILQYSEQGDRSVKMGKQGEEPLVIGNERLKIQEPKTYDLKPITSQVGVGLIGAGLYARGTLLPALKKIKGITLQGISTARGLSGQHIAKKIKFKYCTTDYRELLADPNIHLIFILTRHNLHAKLVCEALKAGKAVFVEKPLCINKEQLREIIETYNSQLITNNCFLMVGFNRRFAPSTRKCIEFIGQKSKTCVVQIRCNAGYIPPDSWVHKKDEGGGRIIGEVCHFVDLAQAIIGAQPKKVFATSTEDPQGLKDSLVISMQMDNGSAVNIAYASSGDKSYSRELVEVFSGGSVCIIDNFRNIYFVSAGKKKKEKSLGVNRGHVEELRATIDALKNGSPSPIDFQSIIATTLATFAIEESIVTGKAIEIDLTEWNIS